MIDLRDKPAILAGKEKISYQLLLNRIQSFSQHFSINKGDRVAIYSANSLEWIYTFYSILSKGGIAVPIDYMSSIDDIAFILEDCKPEIIFTSADLETNTKNSLKKTNHSARIIVFDSLTNEDENNGKPEFLYQNNDTAVIIYTSGTTGSPKGVMLSYENLLVNIKAVTKDVPIITNKERVLMLLPLHHIFPLMGTLIIPLFVGSTIAISPSLNPDDIIATLNDHKVTIIISVPRFYNTIRKNIIDKINKKLITRLLFKLVKSVNSIKFSKLVFGTIHKRFGGYIKYMVSGGAALDKEISNDLYTLGFEILEGYGMTEAAPMICFTRPGKYIPGSPGKVIPDMEVRIHEGEIIARGKNVMQGYYKRPEETNKIIKDGWLFTGDLGRIDKNGAIYITGRKKEIIVLPSGKNINPVEIEEKINLMSTYVKEAAIFLDNNILQALIVPDIPEMRRDGIEKFDDYIRWEIIDKYNQNCSPYKKIMKFSLTAEELPKTRLDKIQRFKLEKIAAINQKEKLDIEEPEFKEYLTIKDYLIKETGNKVYATDHPEMDLALDSLGRVTFIVYIENTFGVKITEQKLTEFNSVVKLAEYVRDKKTHLKHETLDWSAILKEKIHFAIPKPRFMLRIMNFISKLLLNTMFRLKGKGTKNIPDGPCIIAPNHQSFFDGFFVASFLRNKIMKNTYIYAKEKHWRKPWLRFLANRNNIILMDINKDLKTSIQKMATLLQKGKKLIIFPEGTRSKDGSLGTFKKTFAILSHELNVPVIPVAISGSYEVLPSGKSFPRFFRKVEVQFLQPVYPTKRSYNHIRDIVRGKVSQIIERKG